MKNYFYKIIIACTLVGTVALFSCKDDSNDVEIKDISIQTLTAAPKVITMAVGGTRAIKATVTPDGSNQAIYWKSSNQEVATVANGIVIAHAVGDVVITAISVIDNSKTDNVSVKVVAALIPVDSLKLTTAGKDTIYIGDTKKLSVTCFPDNAHNKEVLWTSSNPATASVDKNGVVTALEMGIVTISALAASDVNKSAAVEFLVTDRNVPVSAIKLSADKYALVKGKSKLFTAIVEPDDATDKTLDWESDNPAVATVNNGTVSAVSVGETVIRAKSASTPGKEATIAITVIDVADPLFAKASGLWLFDKASTLTLATIGQDLITSGTGIAPVEGGVRVGKGSYFRCLHSIAANGGGAKVNEYSIMFDFKVPSVGSWYTFLQPRLANDGDASLFINTSGKIGVGSYSTNTIEANKWYRLLFVSTPSGITVYVNSEEFIKISSSGFDHRWALDTAGVLLFADNDGDDAEFDINEVAIWDYSLTAAEAVALGNPY
jgi:uncharacterized protein YjdB